MNRSTHSTQLLSKTYSRIKLAQSNLRRQSPQSRPLSSRSKKNIDSILHESMIAKNKKLSVMIRTLHSYLVSLEELDWVMNETEKIMKNYMKITLEKLGHGHKMQVQNLYNEITKLIQRFSGINKKQIFQMTIPLKENKKFLNSENINLMNFKKTETIGSFKYMQTQNQQQGIHGLQTTDFSKIRLPSVIKQNEAEENIQSSRSIDGSGRKQEYETKIKQYQATIKILKQEIDKEKYDKNQMKKELEDKISNLNKKIQICNNQWQTYKIFAATCTQKCKNYLNEINESCPVGSEKVENILDELFAWQNKLDRKIVEGSLDELQLHKQQIIKQIIDIDSEMKEKKDELDKIQARIKNCVLSNKGMSRGDESELIRILFMQASSIQNLL